MRLIRKPTPWSCILASFTMALNVNTQTLIDIVGHDGSEIIFPGLDEPMCRRGFHVQELVQAAWQLGYSTTPIEVLSAVGAADGRFHIIGQLPKRLRYIRKLVNENKGVITGEGKHCNHAVAFNRGIIFDPEGRSFVYTTKQCEVRHFIPKCLWIVTPRDHTTT